MFNKAIKTTGFSILLAATFLVAVSSSIASAQDNRWRDRDRDGWQDNRRERDDWQDNRRERLEERKGFNDGLIAGRRDALSHRRFNPVITHRRFVSNDYREGFRNGYAQAYHQFAKNRGHRYGRGY
jgi:hypothetical protein